MFLAGIGKLTVDAIFARDYPVVQGAVPLTATLFVLINDRPDLYRARSAGAAVASVDDLRPPGTTHLRALSADRAALGSAGGAGGVAALGAPLLALSPGMPDRQHPGAAIALHWLGADELSRDVLARIISAQSLVVRGILSVAVAALAGTALGLVSGSAAGSMR